MQEVFTKNIEELVVLFNTQKVNLTRYVKKNFKEGMHFIETKRSENTKLHGGQNYINMWLSEESFNLVKNTYNLKNRYIKK